MTTFSLFASAQSAGGGVRSRPAALALLLTVFLISACGDHFGQAHEASPEPAGPGAGFELPWPGIGTELEFPELQLLGVEKLNADGGYALVTRSRQGDFETSPLHKKILSTEALVSGTHVPVLSITGDIHMPFNHSIFGRPRDTADSGRVMISRTLELVSGPVPASVGAQKKVLHHIALFRNAITESAVPWAKVSTLGQAWEDVQIVRGEKVTPVGHVTAKRLVELGSVSHYQKPNKVFGLAALEDVVDKYNEDAEEEFRLSQWHHGKDFAVVLRNRDWPGVGPQASFGITARGYNAGTLASNFVCETSPQASRVSGKELRKACRNRGRWKNPYRGIHACFPSDCLGRSCYLSGVRAFEAAQARRPRFALARQAAQLLERMKKDHVVTDQDLRGPVGDAVTSALVHLRCSTLALAQDVIVPEWKLKNMLGNLPKVTWSDFLDPDFQEASDGVSSALGWLQEHHREALAQFACNPDGPGEVIPQLFLSAPGDAKREVTEGARQRHCREQFERVLVAGTTVGGGTAFSPGRIGGHPAFVVESRISWAPVTQGFTASDWWAEDRPWLLQFTGDMSKSVEFVCGANGFGFDGNECAARQPEPRARRTCRMSVGCCGHN